MNNLENIKNLISDFNNEDFKNLQTLISQQVMSNRKEFENAIMLGDIEKVKEYSQKILMDTDYLSSTYRRVVPHIKTMHFLCKEGLFNHNVKIEKVDIVETFYLLFKNVLNLGDNYEFRKNLKDTTYSANDVFFAGLFYKLHSSFCYSGDEPYPKFIFLKTLLKNQPDDFHKIIHNFCEYALKSVNYSENSLLIKELIDMGYKDKVFEKALSEENDAYLQSQFNPKHIYDEHLMLNVLKGNNYAMVKRAFEHGVDLFPDIEKFPKELISSYKNAYSYVFASKDTFKIQQFIINNIPKINIGNNIIIKTVLHQLEDVHETDIERNQLRVELVKSIVDRLSELNYEEFISIKTLIDKREDSEGKDFFKKYSYFKELEEKFSNPSSNKIKRNKI